MDFRFIVFAGVLVPVSVNAIDNRPNIIYIMTDQQTATAMSCAGNKELNTLQWTDLHLWV